MMLVIIVGRSFAVYIEGRLVKGQK